MSDQVTLRDGTRAWVWPLLPSDRAALAHEFEGLSPESRQQRFLTPLPHLSETMLTQLVDEVDGVDHVALVLLVETEDTLLPVGVARCVRYPNQPDAADVAVTVKDAWQGRGVGTALLEALMRHRPPGITRVITSVTTDNRASLAMLRHLGHAHLSDAGPGILDAVVDLAPEDAQTSSPASSSPVSLDEETRAALRDPERQAFRTRDRLCPWLWPDGS